jgi:hypothetical protein
VLLLCLVHEKENNGWRNAMKKLPSRKILIPSSRLSIPFSFPSFLVVLSVFFSFSHLLVRVSKLTIIIRRKRSKQERFLIKYVTYSLIHFFDCGDVCVLLSFPFRIHDAHQHFRMYLLFHSSPALDLSFAIKESPLITLDTLRAHQHSSDAFDAMREPSNIETQEERV